MAVQFPFPVPQHRDELTPISPISSPQISLMLSLSLNLSDFAHLVHKIPVVAGQRLTTTAFMAVRFPSGEETEPVKLAGTDQASAQAAGHGSHQAVFRHRSN